MLLCCALDFFYLILGLYLSVNTGISTDEFIEQKNWKFSLEAIKDFFGYNDEGYSNLYEYEDMGHPLRYKGVGFFYFSHVYLFIADFRKQDCYERFNAFGFKFIRFNYSSNKLYNSFCYLI